MKLTLVPVLLAVVCVVAGCASTADPAVTAHSTPAPTLSPASTLPPLKGPFGTVLTLPVVKTRPVGKGVAWSAGSYTKTASSVTVDWDDAPKAYCGRAYEVRLDETSSSVIIQLVPGKQTVNACSSVAQSFTMSVPLSAPIGSRPILEQ
jgi:hypothetical protein